VEGIRFGCTVLVADETFFSQGGNPFFLLENLKSPMPSKLRWLTTCLILGALNVRESKGSGIMSGMKLPAQSWRACLDLPRFFHANAGLLSEDLILTWNTTTAKNSQQHQGAWRLLSHPNLFKASFFTPSQVFPISFKSFLTTCSHPNRVRPVSRLALDGFPTRTYNLLALNNFKK